MQHWLPEFSHDAVRGAFHVVIDPRPAGDLPLSILKVVSGPDVVTLTPELAERLSLSSGDRASAEQLSIRMGEAGMRLHGADHLFYLPLPKQPAVRDEAWGSETRELTQQDEEAFTRFRNEAPESDLDDAFVELDHWLVFGTFADGRLVAAASMYPWRGTRLADLGVLTLPGHRGLGFGRRTVRAISARAIELGYEPQYRCQLDNAPSVALAESAGFARFAEWDVLDVDQ